MSCAYLAFTGRGLALAQQLAAESIVLLKNDDTLLPLRAECTRRIAVLGKPAQEPVIQGSGCATTVPYLLDRPLDTLPVKAFVMNKQVIFRDNQRAFQVA